VIFSAKMLYLQISVLFINNRFGTGSDFWG
jgi:hypothetical protein